MTKEELEKESEKYFKSICGDYNEEYERTGKRHYWVGFDIKNAYLAGAEPREKRITELIALINAERERQEKCDDVHLRKIAELEKENAELKGRNAELRGMYVHSAREAGTYKQFLEAKEKENAELKEKYAKNITDCDICDTYCNSQLTKAKEIIKEVMNWYWETDICSDNMPTELRQKAEQFLNEVEK